jgi:hypothetical protein
VALSVLVIFYFMAYLKNVHFGTVWLYLQTSGQICADLPDLWSSLYECSHTQFYDTWKTLEVVATCLTIFAVIAFHLGRTLFLVELLAFGVPHFNLDDHARAPLESCHLPDKD